MSLGTEAGTVARQRLQFALGALEAQSAEAAEGRAAGIAWWNHLIPTQCSYWLRQAQSSGPADTWRRSRLGTRRVEPLN